MSNSGNIAAKQRRGDYQPPIAIEEKVAKESFWEKPLEDAEKSESAARDLLAIIQELERMLQTFPRAMRDAKEFVEREIARHDALRKNKAFRRSRRFRY